MRRFLFLGLLAGLAGSGFAQVAEVSASFGEARASNNSLGSFVNSGGASEVVKEDTGFRFALRFTINQWTHFGHEIGYAYTRSHISSPSLGDVPVSIHMGMYNFLAYATPEGSVIRPFVTGGVHFASFYPPGASVYGGSVTKFGFNFGGGIKVKVKSNWMIRADAREYMQGKPDFGFSGESGLLRILEISGGVAYTF